MTEVQVELCLRHFIFASCRVNLSRTASEPVAALAFATTACMLLDLLGQQRTPGCRAQNSVRGLPECGRGFELLHVFRAEAF